MKRIKGAVDNKALGNDSGFIDFTIKENQSDDKNQLIDMNDIYQYIVKSNESWEINYYRPIISHRKIIGQVIVFIKKAIRKILSWYINPIIEQQITFNSNVVNALNQIANAIEKQSCCNDANYDTSKKYDIVDNKIKEIKDDINKNITEVQSLIAQVENGYKTISENIRNEAKELLSERLFKKLAEMDSSQGLYQRALLEIMECIKISDSESNLMLFENIFKLKNNVQLQKNINNNLVILCKDFMRDNINEAIKKEAFTYFQILKNNNRNVKFLSFESSITELTFDQDNNVYYCPYENCYEEVKKLSPDTLHFFENSPNHLFLDNMKLMEFKIIYTLTGVDPIFDIDNNHIEELLHQCEMQKVSFVTECEYAAKIMKEKGFKIASRISPVSDINRSTIFHSERQNMPFTIGFASSPMLEEHYESRGVDLFIDAADKLPDINFSIAWRNENIKIRCNKLKENMRTEYGVIDMNRFLDDCDIIVLPYSQRINTHAFPLSALEMLMKGKPVVCTELAGISDFISHNNLGVVCKPDVEGLCTAILDCVNNYNFYIEQIALNASRINNKDSYLQAYENIYRNAISNEVIPLFMWRQTLKENDSRLIKGTENMKLYYRESNVVENYNDDRFKYFPMNCYNIEECESVKIIINEVFNNHNLKLMDIACGEGRILKELVTYGECFGIDSSPAMLMAALDKISQKYDNPNLQLITKDFFDCEINNVFDVITVFRYIRHFEYPQRRIIYDKIHRLLNNDGILIFDVPNIAAESLLRKYIGWNKFNIYDVFWTEQSIFKELEENGFIIIKKIDIGEGLIDYVPGLNIDTPLSWVVAARKSGA